MDEVLTIQNDIDKSNAIYYNGGVSPFTDYEYDLMKRKLGQLAPDDPRLQTVGAPVPTNSPLKKVKHTFVMGSLKDAMTVDEFISWFDGVHKPGYIYHISPKMDGFSLALYYDNGRLVSAVTRGDGFVGEDITHNAIQFQGVPINLPHPFTGPVRGETVLHVDTWRELDPDTESNPRNIASGIARRKESNQAELLTFYPFDMEGSGLTSHTQEIDQLVSWGFERAPYCQVITTRDEVINAYQNFINVRSGLPFWIDGMVVRIDDTTLFDSLGMANKRPRAASAFKFPAEEVISTLEKVTLTVGHTGKIAPTGWVTPVRVAGSEVKKAYLCNFVEIKRLKLTLGCQVIVIKAGDIIPKIIAAKNTTDKEITEPTSCPVCNGAVGHVKLENGDSLELFCLNDACPAKSKGKISRWIRSLDIKELGDSILDCLIGAGIMATIADLYKLDEHKDDIPNFTMSGGQKIGKKRTAKILSEINASTSMTAAQFVGSLGVDNLGKRKAEHIIEDWRKLELDGDPNFLDHPMGWFGDVLTKHAVSLGLPNSARSIQDSYNNMHLIVADILNTNRITIIEPLDEIEALDGPLNGKTFLLTGKFAEVKNVIEEKIIQAGGLIHNGVNKTLDYLVQADPTKESGKSKKAVKLGVQVISEDELVSMM